MTNERRRSDERRNDERRHVSEGAPERRAADRRHENLGPPERRLAVDRRLAESGPPSGWRDRRREAERRIPEVLDAAFAEWVRLRVVRERTTGSAAPAEPVERADHELLEKMIIRD
jgi:hypothetical protein